MSFSTPQREFLKLYRPRPRDPWEIVNVSPTLVLRRRAAACYPQRRMPTGSPSVLSEAVLRRGGRHLIALKCKLRSFAINTAHYPPWQRPLSRCPRQVSRHRLPLALGEDPDRAVHRSSLRSEITCCSPFRIHRLSNKLLQNFKIKR